MFTIFIGVGGRSGPTNNSSELVYKVDVGSREFYIMMKSLKASYECCGCGRLRCCELRWSLTFKGDAAKGMTHNMGVITVRRSPSCFGRLLIRWNFEQPTYSFLSRVQFQIYGQFIFPPASARPCHWGSRRKGCRRSCHSANVFWECVSLHTQSYW